MHTIAMERNDFGVIGWIGLGAAALTAGFGPWAIFAPLFGTLGLAYFAFTTEPRRFEELEGKKHPPERPRPIEEPRRTLRAPGPTATPAPRAFRG